MQLGLSAIAELLDNLSLAQACEVYAFSGIVFYVSYPTFTQWFD